MKTDVKVTTDEYNKQRRTVEMNVYYEKKYASYLDVLKYFTIYCIILLILAILRKRMILSYSFTNILTMVLIIVAGIHLYLKIADINMRDNMDFDEYDWNFNPDNHSDPNKLDTNIYDSANQVVTCVEDACCNTDTTKWCASQGKCVLKTAYCEGDENNPWIAVGGEWVVSDKQTNVTCPTDKIWCYGEQKCLNRTASCKTSPDDSTTDSLQASQPDTDTTCNDKHSSDCQNMSIGNHHNITQHNTSTSTESFVSKISNTFNSFNISLNSQYNKPTNIQSKDKIPSVVKAFSPFENKYSSV